MSIVFEYLAYFLWYSSILTQIFDENEHFLYNSETRNKKHHHWSEKNRYLMHVARVFNDT